MTYRILQAPFSLQYSTMSKPELRAYYDWFMTVLPERIAELERVVTDTDAHRAWRADFSRDSLSPLGHWLWGQVETRDELDDELTDRTLSLAMDIGMYVGKVLESTGPGATWGQLLNDESSLDYGQPVIVGLGPVPFNPVRVIVTLANRIASKKRSIAAMRALYGVLKGMKRNSASP